MTVDWSPLLTELDIWRGEGLTLPVWWRDDDAVDVTQHLERLNALSERLDWPVHLAVIPMFATPQLAEFVSRRSNLIPVVHGWAHESHAPKGEKNAEFGDHRSLQDMAESCVDARRRLRALFGDQLAAMFVPPWNRISDDLVLRLPDCGFHFVSTYQPREHTFAAPGLLRINTHLDPIDWRGGKVLRDQNDLIRQITEQLSDRRLGSSDAGEPYGILTHHLVHDDAIWAFCEKLMGILRDGPVHFWTATELKQ